MLTSTFILNPLIPPDPKLSAGAGNADYSSNIPISSPKPLLMPVLLPLFDTCSNVSLKLQCSRPVPPHPIAC